MRIWSVILMVFVLPSGKGSDVDLKDCLKVPGTCDQSGNAPTLTVPKTFSEPLTKDDELRILYQNELLFKVVEPGENVILSCSSSKYYLNKLNYSNGKSSTVDCYKFDTSTSSPSKTRNKAANRIRMFLFDPVGLFGVMLLGMGMV